METARVNNAAMDCPTMLTGDSSSGGIGAEAAALSKSLVEDAAAYRDELDTQEEGASQSCKNISCHRLR